MPQRGDEQEEGESDAQDFETVTNSAVNSGLRKVIQDNPNFKNHPEYISRHIVKEKLDGLIRKAYAEVGPLKGLTDEQRTKLFYDKISQGVADGQAFDDSAKRVFKLSPLEQNATSTKLRYDEEDRKLSKVREPFEDLYRLMQSGDYAKNLPELTEATTKIYNNGLLNTAVEVLYRSGLMNDRRYAALKLSIRDSTHYHAAKADEAIGEYATQHEEKKISSGKKYALPKRVAAAFFAVFGLLAILVSGSGLTGGVIGVNSTNIRGIDIGLFSLLLGMITYLFIPKEED